MAVAALATGRLLAAGTLGGLLAKHQALTLGSHLSGRILLLQPEFGQLIFAICLAQHGFKRTGGGRLQSSTGTHLSSRGVTAGARSTAASPQLQCR